MDYQDFLKRKTLIAPAVGISVDKEDINPQLFDFQRDIVRWALRKGRAAIFAGCGLGKTPMQLEWARHVHNQTHGDVLILAPLAVASQTVQEGLKFGIEVHLCRKQADVKHGINITNYEMLQNERALTLWTNEGDIVLSPFAGIGSEGYVALQMKRRFVGIELKRSYYEQATRNLAEAERPDPQVTILDVLETGTE